MEIRDRSGRRDLLWRLIAAAFAGIAVALPQPGQAEGSPLLPGTKIRLSVIHWSPGDGEYRAWDAVSGEFLISQQGTVLLPIVGSMSVSKMDTGALAADLSGRLQVQTGLVAKPDVTVEVLEYAPIYVMGAVPKPGEYKFSPGLTVLQAVAMGGGVAKEGPERSREQLAIVGRLKETDASMLLGEARIARLEAELAGAATITFPSIDKSSPSAAVAEDVFGREQAIFTARSQQLERQTANLSELKDFFVAEIELLEQKREGTEHSIKTTEDQLKAITSLVEKGVVVTSRQSDLERELSDLRSERLDHITAVMRAKQNIAETTRNIDSLKDEHQTEVATTLQAERATLRQMELRRDMDQKLLLEAVEGNGDMLSSDGQGSITYLISRMENGKPTEMAATDSTVLMPGDVVTLKVDRPRLQIKGDLSSPERRSSADHGATLALR